MPAMNKPQKSQTMPKGRLRERFASIIRRSPATPARPAEQQPQQPPITDREVRAWARANSIEVGPRGPVSGVLVARFREANQR